MLNWLRAAFGSFLSGGASVSDPHPGQQSKEDLPVWLIVGLGNPGREHEDNRHNIGFMAVDRMVADHGFGLPKNRFNGQIFDGVIGRTKVVALKPATYMNRSGQSVAEAARFYKIPPEKIVVLHDELDLPLGKLRVKTGGGAAGHNGLKSIDADMGDQNYVRVRIGIGHPGEKSRVSGYVLSDFTEDERHLADIKIAAISRHLDYLLAGREAEFMTKISEETKVK